MTDIVRYPFDRLRNHAEQDTPLREKEAGDQKAKTYNRRDSQMVTHSSTSHPVQCLCMAERTGCPVFTDLWSYVPVESTLVYMIKAGQWFADSTQKTTLAQLEHLLTDGLDGFDGGPAHSSAGRRFGTRSVSRVLQRLSSLRRVGFDSEGGDAPGSRILGCLCGGCEGRTS